MRRLTSSASESAPAARARLAGDSGAMACGVRGRVRRARHHGEPLPPDAALGDLVGARADKRAVAVAPLAIQPPPDHQPRLQQVGLQARLDALENLDVVGAAEARRSEKRLMAE